MSLNARKQINVAIKKGKDGTKITELRRMLQRMKEQVCFISHVHVCVHVCMHESFAVLSLCATIIMHVNAIYIVQW